MLRTTPSRIELKQEDIREYEEMKGEWKKELQKSNNYNQNKNNNNEKIHHDPIKNAQKNERHKRMGFDPN
jgi:hypothetical protein